MKTMVLSGLLNAGPVKIQMCVDELTYRSYSYNRSRSPHVTPEQWRKCCPSFTEAMERRYQKELQADKGAMI
jgi:hypothetical protein